MYQSTQIYTIRKSCKYIAGSERIVVGQPINSLSYKEFIVADKIVSVLLINAPDSKVRMYSFNQDNEKTKVFSPWGSCPIVNRALQIHSSFSPVVTTKQESYFATGSEDTKVRIFAYTKELPPPASKLVKFKQVDELAGHTSAVLDVAWNDDETLLASSDNSGTVIVWKRAEDKREPSPRSNT